MKIGKEMAKKKDYPIPHRFFQDTSKTQNINRVSYTITCTRPTYLLNGYNIFSNSMENSVSYLGYFSISFEKKLHSDLSF